MAIWDKSLFDSVYTSNGWPNGMRGSNRVPRFHYNWCSMRAVSHSLFESYQALPGFAQVNDIAIIGGGFGWVAEKLSSIGINAICVDTSPHVIATKDSSEEGEIRAMLVAQGFDPDLNDGIVWCNPQNPKGPGMNPWQFWLRTDGKRTSATIVEEDLSTNGSRNSVRRALNNNVDAIVTELVLDGLDTEQDGLVLIERCEQLRPNPACAVVHIVMDGHGDNRFVNKTGAEWDVLLNDNGYNHIVVDTRGVVLTAGG